MEREIKRDVSKSPLGISSPCWCNSGGGWSAGPGMHEEFQSNQEGANDQHKQRTLCHSKVILKRSTIVTCCLVGKGGRQRRGRSGKTTARCFLGEVRKTPSRGLKLSLSPLPGDLSLLAASHTTGSSPGWFRKSLRLSKRSPLATSDTGSFQSFPVPRSAPGNSSVRNFELPRTAGAVISPARRGAPASPRCFSGVT